MTFLQGPGLLPIFLNKLLALENTYSNPEPNVNILDDVDIALHQASGGKRFANWLIDRIVIYILWRIFFAAVGTKMVVLMYRGGDTLTSIYIKLYLTILVLDLFLLTAIEYLGRGKTVGKLVTGTRAVNEDGTPITFKTALLRTLSRIVPFEPFSALGNPAFPWHDRWTKTYVVDEKLSRLPPGI